MPPIGDTLRRERLRRNLELPQIAQELKISTRFLKAIEEEKFDQLPATVFAKNFVRQYATLLELDGEDLALQAQRLLETRSVAPEFPPVRRPDVPELPMDNEKPWEASSAGRGSGSSWITAAALFVAAMLVCSAAYWWWERPHQQVVAHVVEPPAVKVAQPPASQPVAAAPVGSGLPSASAPLSETPLQRATPEPVAGTANAPAGVVPAVATSMAPAAAANPNAAARVEITALDTVWVRARVNGKYLFAATLQAHQTRNVDTDGVVELLLGNAGGASIALNGKPLSLEGFPAGTIGPKGQVREVQLTSGGFQMVPSRAPDPRDR
jgi:cytoskeletal protein RodZ